MKIVALSCEFRMTQPNRVRLSMSLRCRVLLGLLLLCGCQGVLAAIVVNDLDQPVPITQAWQFKAGDDLLWAAPELDDSGWHAVDSLSSRPESHEEDAGLGWYRLTILLNMGETAVQRQLGALAVSIGGVDSALLSQAHCPFWR